MLDDVIPASFSRFHDADNASVKTATRFPALTAPAPTSFLLNSQSLQNKSKCN